MVKEPKYISLQEATKYCPYSQEYLSLLARTKRLKAIKIGRNWVTTKEWVEEYLERVRENTKKNEKRQPIKVEVKSEEEEVPSEILPTEIREPEKSLPKVRFAFLFALALVLLVAGVVLGKGSLKMVFEEVDPYVTKIGQEVDEGIFVSWQRINEGVGVISEAGDLVLEGITKSFKESFANVFEDISQFSEDFYQFSRGVVSKIGEIASFGLAGINQLDEVFQEIPKSISQTSKEIGQGLGEIGKRIGLGIIKGSREIGQGIWQGMKALGQGTKNLAQGIAEKITQPFKKEVVVRKKEILLEKLEERIGKLSEELEKLKIEGLPVREIVREFEVSKITKIEPVKEITREIKILDDESLRKIRASLSQQETEIGRLKLAAELGYVNFPPTLGLTGGTTITTLGTITTGNWQGTAIATKFGGTGKDLSAVEQGSLLYFSGTGTIATLAPGTPGQFLQTQGAGADPVWATVSLATGGGWSDDGTIVRLETATDTVGIGTATPNAKLEVLATTEQLRLSYDASNRMTVTVGATGGVTFDSVGTGAGFTFLDNVTISGFTSGSVLFAGTGGIISQDNSNLFWDNTNKRLGIGTTNPAYTLDVSGNLRATLSLTAGINIETLTADKTLIPGTDKMYQYLNPNGANRVITLDTTTAKAGDKFVIRNNGDYSSSYYLQINQGASAIDYIYAQSIREYIFNGTNWVAGDVGTGIAGDYNVAVGFNAIGYSLGTAVGYNAKGYSSGAAVGYFAFGYNSGAAVGYQAEGYNYGAAVGYQALGYFYGAAVGYQADGYFYGAAVGYQADGYSSGAAVGYQADGYSSGVAVGTSAQGNDYGTAVGYYAKGMRYGAAVGYQAGLNIDTTADRYNVLMGAYSGYRLTTGIGNIILGYQSGYDAIYSPTTGSKNILIGFQAGTPATSTSNFLNIGNLIFATGVNTASGAGISTGKVGIGTTTPEYTLDIAGNLRASLSLTAGINVETLAADRTLTPGTDKMYQYLNPNGANRVITLDTTTAKAGDKFVIRNNGDYSSSYYLQINQGASAIDYIYAQSIREYIFNGTNWVAGDVGTGIAGDYNVAVGFRAIGSSSGTAVGYYAQGYGSGAAVGYFAQGHSSGAAVGYNAKGYYSGAAVGYFAQGYSSGAAVGYYAQGYGSGAAVGYFAQGYSSGAAVGYYAKGMRYGAAVGYQAGLNIDTTADRYNVLMGAYSGYQLTTGIGNIILGYQSGYDAIYSPTTGSKNILIGFQAGTPATSTSNFLNIGNLIFATGVNTASGAGISTGNVGIGTTEPAQELEVVGDIRTAFTGSATLNGVCHSGADLDSAGTISDRRDLVVCSGTPGDIAEWYDTTGAEPGEIVVPTDETITYESPIVNALTGEILEKKTKVKVSVLAKSTKPYQSNILGVISSSPVQTFGRAILDNARLPRPVSLIGRVPVKVSIENGPISIGDPLTSSNIPGVAMKATEPGRVIGIALEPFDGSQCQNQNSTSTNSTSTEFGICNLEFGNSFPIGKIMVFVNVSYYLPTESLEKVDVANQDSPTFVDLLFSDIAGFFREGLKKLGLLVEEGIAKVKELFAEKVTTKELCLGGEDGETICITKDQLKVLINNSQFSIPNSQINPNPEQSETEAPAIDGVDNSQSETPQIEEFSDQPQPPENQPQTEEPAQ